MNRKRWILTLGLAAALAQSAVALPYVFRYSTTLDATAIGLSASETATYDYGLDSLATDFNPAADVGDYAITSGRLTLGAYSWDFNVVGGQASYVHVENNTPTDLYAVQFDAINFLTPGKINGWTFSSGGFNPYYVPGTTSNWTSAALVTDAQLLDGLGWSRAGMTFRNSSNTLATLRLPGATGPGYFMSDSAVPYSLLSVPEPGLARLWESL